MLWQLRFGANTPPPSLIGHVSCTGYYSPRLRILTSGVTYIYNPPRSRRVHSSRANSDARAISASCQEVAQAYVLQVSLRGSLALPRQRHLQATTVPRLRVNPNPNPIGGRIYSVNSVDGLLEWNQSPGAVKPIPQYGVVGIDCCAQSPLAMRIISATITTPFGCLSCSKEPSW